MRKQFRLSLQLLFCICGFLSEGRATDLTCHGFEGTTPQAALEYLQQDRSTLEDACVMKAIQLVGDERYKPAIKTLFNYLDFEKPLPPGVPHQIHLSPTGGVYPAADMIAHFRESIVPDLRFTIRNDNVSKRARLNAAEVYFWISQSPATVGFVAKAGHEAVDPASGKELVKVAERFAHECPSDKQEDCRNALNTQ